MRRLLLTLIPLLLAGLLPAQPRPGEGADKLEYDANHVARRLLASDDVIEIAWGAHVAARHGLTERIPELRRKLRETARDHARHIGTTRLLLDALVRLRAAVHGAEVMPYFDRCPDEVIVLLSATPHANREALLEILERRRQTVHWLAAGGLLAKVKSAAFAGYLVRRLHVTLSVTVADTKIDRRMRSGAISSGLSGGRAHYRRGLPPVPHYRLVTSPERNNTVLCAGPCPVYYKRFTSATRSGRRSSSRDTRYYACRFLAQMADVSYSELRFDHAPWLVVVWQGPEDLTARIRKLRGESLAGWRKMIGRLADAKLVDPALAAVMEPSFEVALFDERSDKSTPLPRFKE